MSASIYWERIKKTIQTIPVNAPSRFITNMNEAFGEHPWILDEDSIGLLRGMAIVSNDGDTPNPYNMVINKILEHGAIKTWPEY